jgi:hypothetical protein
MAFIGICSGKENKVARRLARHYNSKSSFVNAPEWELNEY